MGKPIIKLQERGEARYLHTITTLLFSYQTFIGGNEARILEFLLAYINTYVYLTSCIICPVKCAFSSNHNFSSKTIEEKSRTHKKNICRKPSTIGMNADVFRYAELYDEGAFEKFQFNLQYKIKTSFLLLIWLLGFLKT